MAGLSPTQRTLKSQREQGRLCAIAERSVKIPGLPYPLKQDLFGIIDVIALDPVEGIIGVQSCGSDYAAHMRKMTEVDEDLPDKEKFVRGTQLTRPELCLEWLKAGGRLELWGWRRIKKKRGGKMMIWSPRIHVFQREDFE